MKRYTLILLLTLLTGCGEEPLRVQTFTRCGDTVTLLGRQTIDVTPRRWTPLDCDTADIGDNVYETGSISTGSFLSLDQPTCAFDVTRNGADAVIGAEYVVPAGTVGCGS